jgi:hypothetical protein
MQFTPLLSKRVRTVLSPLAGVIVCAVLSACYYSVPITPQPSSKIDPRVLGKWYGSSGEVILVERTDDFHYAIRQGAQTFPAFHSDVNGQRFANVKVADKYLYLIYKLEEHGSVLRAQSVSTKTIPASVKTSAEVQGLLAQNLSNRKLFEDTQLSYAREAPIGKSKLLTALGLLRPGDVRAHADILDQIRIRGVDFELTPTIQAELENAGARPELIEIARKNFRGKKKT